MGIFSRLFRRSARPDSGRQVRRVAQPDHGYLDGQTVQCQRCQKRITVRLHGNDGVVVAVASELQGTALRCLQCDFITCYACATRGAEPAIPICPSCGAEGGPYFFLK